MTPDAVYILEISMMYKMWTQSQDALETCINVLSSERKLNLGEQICKNMKKD